MGHYDIVLSQAISFQPPKYGSRECGYSTGGWSLEADVTALMITITPLGGGSAVWNVIEISEGSTKGQNRLTGKDRTWIYLGLRDTMELCALTFTGWLALRLVFNAG
jgi:hypothetical protein